MEKNSVFVKGSRYVSGGTTEVNPTALEWWERLNFVPNADDTEYVVEARYAGRLDLIAAAYLGEARMWWIIGMYNNILDPYNEIQEGLVLRIPTTARAQSMLNGKMGGYPSTREVQPSIFPIV